MGQSMSSGLSQLDVDDLITHCDGVFSQSEIEAMYRRFRALDRSKKGFITSEEFMSIPELSINPLAGRLSYFFESINFRDFVRLLAPFSPKASEDDKLRLMFDVLDVDGDGALSAEDLEQMLHYMAGSSLDNEQLQEIIAQVMKDVGAAPRGITFAQYRGALKARTGDLNVSIPVDA